MNYRIDPQLQELKFRVQRDTERTDETFRIGVEVEGCLLDNKGIPVNAEPLIRELRELLMKLTTNMVGVNLNIKPLQ
jgi:hypothetical protein